MALDHHAEDAAATRPQLCRHIARHVDLSLVLLAAVGMAAIDHQGAVELRGLDLGTGRSHMGGVVVRCLATAQDDVAVGVAARLDDRDLAIFVHRQEMVRAGGGLDRIGGDPDVAVGAVLETDRRRQAGGEFAVNLALGRARTDRAPGDQVADVLRRDDVEKLTARRHARAVDFEQQLARDSQAFINAKALVEVGVVDEAFPADRRTGLLEIDPHHDLERVAVLVALHLQPLRVLHRGDRIVDGARPHDHEQAVVLLLHDPADRVAGVSDQRLDRRAGDRKEPDQVLGRRQRHHVLDPLVVGLARALAVRIPTFGGRGVRIDGHDGSS